MLLLLGKQHSTLWQAEIDCAPRMRSEIAAEMQFSNTNGILPQAAGLPTATVSLITFIVTVYLCKLPENDRAKETVQVRTSPHSRGKSKYASWGKKTTPKGFSSGFITMARLVSQKG